MRKIIIHPFLFAIFPILFLYAHNIDLTPVGEIFIPILISILFASSMVLIAYLFTRDIKKSAIISSLGIFLFFTYGHIYQSLQGLKLYDLTIVRHRYLLSLWAILFITGIYFIVRIKSQLKTITRFLNITSIILIVIAISNISIYMFKSHTQVLGNLADIPENLKKRGPHEPETLPNIYYIILDGYARQDVLKDIYDYDNSDFIKFLEEKGFYVAKRSNSNYCQTLLSLSSSLNLNFIQNLTIEKSSLKDRSILLQLIKHNVLFEFLKQHKYKIVAFSSGYYGTEIKSADIYKNPIKLSEFHIAIINTTPILAIKHILIPNHYDLHRKKILYTFKEIPGIKTNERPVFVFAHMLVPHPPFVFEKNGDKAEPKTHFMYLDGSHLLRFIKKEQYIEGYRNQLIFINKKTKEMIENLLNRNPKPIIILQSDHGPGSHLDWENPENTYFGERMAILNAYYLPDGGDELLYDSISPVNTFRVVLNHYFGTDLELLEDRSYFSCWSTPYDFIDVTDEINNSHAN